MKAYAILALILLASLGQAGAVRGAEKPLNTDLARARVEISAGFTGASIIVFGVMEQPGDIVVVLRSQIPGAQTVLRKEHVLGFWIDRSRMAFTGVPAFYGVASNRPLIDIAKPAAYAELAVNDSNPIGIDYLPIAKDDQSAKATEFRAGLVKAKIRAGLYTETLGRVDMLPGNLFKAELQLPARIPPGLYNIRVYYFRDGALIDLEQKSLHINKIGIGATISSAATKYGLLYGLFALLAAVVAGLTSGYLFRRQ